MTLNKKAILPFLVTVFSSPLWAQTQAHVDDKAQAEKAQPITGAGESMLEETLVMGELGRYSALKDDVPIVDIARSVSIVDELDMKLKGVTHIDQAFNYSAGITGQTFGFATRGDWLRVRGFEVPQYQDSLQSLFGNYNNTRPDVYTLEQTEVLKGPASVLYGKGSPGGLLNVVSKRPKAERRTEIVAELGNFNHKQIALDSTGAIDSDDEFLYRVVAVGRDSDTQVDYVSDKTKVFAPSFTWSPSEKSNITLLLNYTDTESDTGAQFLPISGTLNPAVNGKYIENSRYMGEPGFNHYNATTTALTLLADHAFNEVWSWELTSRYTDASADYQQAWQAFSTTADRFIYNADGSLYKDGMVPRSFYRNDATSEQAAIDTRLRADLTTGEISHNVLMGLQYQDVTTTSAGYSAWAVGYDYTTQGPDQSFSDLMWLNVFSPNYGQIPDAAYQQLESMYAKNPESNNVDLGVYVSDQITWGKLNVTLGLRYDDSETTVSDPASATSTSQKDDALSSSLGILYKTSVGISPYINYAESFEPVIGTSGIGPEAKALKPQEGQQVEVGLKYQPEQLPALFTLAAFEIEQSNLTDPNGSPGGYDQQSGVAKVKGVEFEGLVNLGAFDWQFALTQLDTETSEGKHFASVPEQQASTWLGYGAANGFKAGAGLRYVGTSWGGQDIIETPSHSLADLMLGYAFSSWDVSVNVSNLTDKDYQATCLSRGDCFPGNARTVIGRVRYEF
ncbi:TonB-dependent siderophore receptor [Agaribacterium sp. ZY112]|uniref:TonB-dependent siderophore receptor n=1 Tax=Agaribacterium sp. ZY112 TaxID=3233574 RepID=UPI0035237BD6